MRLVPMVIPFSLLACVPKPTGSCGGEKSITVAACAMPNAPADAGLVQGSEQPFVMTVDGVVEETGMGLPSSNDCFRNFGIRGWSADPAQASWIKVRDEDGGVFTVAAVMPSVPSLGGVGERVHVDHSWQEFEFVPSLGSFTLSDSDGGVRAFVATAGSLGAIVPPPGVTFSAGDPSCTGFSSCGGWEVRRLRVSLGNARGELETGESRSIGGMQVHNGGIQNQTAFRGFCQDWVAGDATVGLARE